MKATPLSLGMDLERAFRCLYDKIDVSHDGFSISPTKEIAAGLESLCSAGIIKTEGLSGLLQEFDFGDGSLRDIIADEISLVKIQELVGMLKEWAKNQQSYGEDEK